MSTIVLIVAVMIMVIVPAVAAHPRPRQLKLPPLLVVIVIAVAVPADLETTKVVVKIILDVVIGYVITEPAQQYSGLEATNVMEKEVLVVAFSSLTAQ